MIDVPNLAALLNAQFLLVLGGRALALVVIWSVVYFSTRLVIRALDRVGQSNHTGLDSRSLQPARTLIRWGLILLGLMLSFAALDLTPLLLSFITAAGVAGIVIGFAVRDIATNFISGIFLLIDRPFVPGDEVKIGDVAGVVENVSLRSTLIRTADGPVVYVPNSNLITGAVTNYTVYPLQRIEVTVTVPATANLEQQMAELIDAARSIANILADPSPAVQVSAFKGTTVDLTLTAWVPRSQHVEVASDLRRAVAERMKDQA